MYRRFSLVILLLGVSALSDINNQATQSLWTLNGNLRIRVNCAMYVNLREIGNFKVCMFLCSAAHMNASHYQFYQTC